MTDHPALRFVIPVWPYAFGGPSGNGDIRSATDDFIVKEQLGYEPSGDGEHVFLQIQKSGENTSFVVKKLAGFAGVNQRDIGYAGLKDRHARTTQWFSVRLPGREEPAWPAFNTPSITVLQSRRNLKKLKKGALAGNEFIITIRNWQGDKKRTQQILEQIKIEGIPNYFGEQRFGNDGNNINRAMAMFNGERVKRYQRGLFLSAARSFLFNCMLAKRVELGNWNEAIPGDVLMFDRSGAYFYSAQPDEEIVSRIQSGAVHPSGPLWGAGISEVTGEAEAIERAVLDNQQRFTRGLLDFKTEMARRPYRVFVENLTWKFNDQDDLILEFFLPKGSFATSVLREIIS